MSVAPGAADEAVRRYARTAFAFDVLEQTQRYSFFESQLVPGAIVPYRSDGAVDVVMGEPAAPEPAIARVTAEFLASRPPERAVLAFATSKEFALAAVEVGASAAQMVAEPELDPTAFKASGGSAKKLRQHVRRLHAAGVTATAIAPVVPLAAEFRSAADALLAEWSARVVPEHAFVLEIDPWRRSEEKRYFYVADESGKRLWSLLIAHPIYALGGWHLCHLMHSPDAPSGVNDLVAMAAIERFACENVRYVTFGPFAAPELNEVLGAGRFVRAVLTRTYRTFARRGRHDQAAEFYRKFQPGPWRPRYMVFYPGRRILKPVLAMLRLTHVTGFHRSH